MEKTSVLAKLKQGDETSFTFVYDHYWRKVYRFSEIYLNDDEEIKEAVQEVFIKLWESRASINENKDIDGLLFIMTRNTIFDYFRKSLNKVTMKITALEVAEKIAISDETLEVKDLLEYMEISFFTSTTTTRGFYHEQETTNDKQRNSRTT